MYNGEDKRENRLWKTEKKTETGEERKQEKWGAQFKYTNVSGSTGNGKHTMDMCFWPFSGRVDRLTVFKTNYSWNLPDTRGSAFKSACRAISLAISFRIFVGLRSSSSSKEKSAVGGG